MGRKQPTPEPTGKMFVQKKEQAHWTVVPDGKWGWVAPFSTIAIDPEWLAEQVRQESKPKNSTEKLLKALAYTLHAIGLYLLVEGTVESRELCISHKLQLRESLRELENRGLADQVLTHPAKERE